MSASFPLLCLCIMPSSFSLVFSSSGAFGVLSLCSGERGNWNPLSWSSEGRPAISLACFSLFSFSNPPLVFHQFFLWFPPFQSPRFCPFLPVFPRFFFSLSAWLFRVPPPPLVPFFLCCAPLYKQPSTLTPPNIINGTSWAKNVATFSAVSVESGWRR